MNLPLWLYLITYCGDLQLAGWFAMFQIIRKQVLPSRQRIIKPARIILTLSFLALTINHASIGIRHPFFEYAGISFQAYRYRLPAPGIARLYHSVPVGVHVRRPIDPGKQ